jgi:homoserine O-succinyltransferase/O-acetyltransferase
MMPLVPYSAHLPLQSCRNCDHEPIVIGLVNNMPDAALRTTERQFRELLSAASDDIAVCLRMFSLPELPRSDTGRAHIDRYYEPIKALWTSDLDGLIVTGTEPRCPMLSDEPYWGTLTKLVDWAEEHTTSAVWSCLAAHAAVLHLDGIVRRPLGEKLVGVFDCAKTMEHPTLANSPSQWRIPHSRYNELPETALCSRGYRILSWSALAGADMFVAQRKSLFLFLQGHPEYDPAALLREYRRDVARFLAGERDRYPEIPCGYFDQDTAATLASFRKMALCKRGVDLLSSFPAVHEVKLAHAWRGPATLIYANWLSYLVEQRFGPLAGRWRRPSSRVHGVSAGIGAVS